MSRNYVAALSKYVPPPGSSAQPQRSARSILNYFTQLSINMPSLSSKPHIHDELVDLIAERLKRGKVVSDPKSLGPYFGVIIHLHLISKKHWLTTIFKHCAQSTLAMYTRQSHHSPVITSSFISRCNLLAKDWNRGLFLSHWYRLRLIFENEK